MFNIFRYLADAFDGTACASHGRVRVGCGIILDDLTVRTGRSIFSRIATFFLGD